MDALAVLVYEADANKPGRLLCQQTESLGPLENIAGALVGKEATAYVFLGKERGEAGRVLCMVGIR